MKLPNHAERCLRECTSLIDEGLEGVARFFRDLARGLIGATYLIPVLLVIGRVQDISRDIAKTRDQVARLHPRVEYFWVNSTTEVHEDIYVSEYAFAVAMAQKKIEEMNTELKAGFNEAKASLEEFNLLSIFAEEENEVEDEIKDYYPEGTEEVILASSAMDYQCAEGEFREGFDQ